jgi:hypothetical protein
MSDDGRDIKQDCGTQASLMPVLANVEVGRAKVADFESLDRLMPPGE